jgi:hypothetical protein
MEEALRKMKITRVGINESIQFIFLSRKRHLSKRILLAQSTKRETQNGGTKRDKKKEKLFKHPVFLDPACDGQHGYQVPSVNSSFIEN